MASINMETPESIAADLLWKHSEKKKSSYDIRLLIFSISTVAFLILFIYSLTQLHEHSSWMIGILTSGTLLVLILVQFLPMLCCCYLDLHQQKILERHAANIKPVIWRLDGQQWQSYVNHVYRQIDTVNHLSLDFSECFSHVRKRKLHKLLDRGYGYIVFFPFLIIIDELTTYGPETASGTPAKLIFINQRQRAVQTYRIRQIDRNGEVYDPLDLFIPYHIQQAEDYLPNLVVAFNESVTGMTDKASPQNFEKFRSMCENSANTISSNDPIHNVGNVVQQPNQSGINVLRF